MNTMVSHPHSTTHLLASVRSKLESEAYGQQTIKAYLGQLNVFFRHIHPREPYAVTTDDILQYLNHQVASDLSRSTVDQAVNALNFFCKSALGRPLDLSGFQRPRKVKAAQVVLTLDEVKRIAISTENPKHRLMIELSYTGGLRVSEVVHVRVKHLDLAKLKLFVPDQDGEDEGRTTIFSGSLKDALARQIGNKKPEDYLFPSERGGPLTTRAVAKFFKAALAASGVSKPATPHSLRHSFAEFMLKNGNRPQVVQNLMGLGRTVKGRALDED